MTTLIDLNRFAQIKATGHLPSPRGIALGILRMSQDDLVSSNELARVIRGDPAFVGRLIKAANGMMLRQRAIVSVQEALMAVGITAVRAMALGFSLLSNYRKGQCPGFDYSKFWSSSIIMAQTMQILAGRTRVVAADELFSIGLLARVGELALATVYPAKYGQLLAEGGNDLAEREQQELSITHSDLAAAMLADWGIPDVFVSAVRYCERPLEVPFSAEGREMSTMQCLILARCVADIFLSEPSVQENLMGKAIRLAAQLGCTREVFVSDCNEIARQWYEWSKLLQLDAVELPSFEKLSGIEAGKPVNGQSMPEHVPGVQAGSSQREETPCELRAMLIGDDDAIRQQILGALKDIGVRAIEHSGVDDVMEAILDVQPNILILEAETDPQRVSRLIRTLRASRIGRSLYILLLLTSGIDRPLAVFEAGADDFFSKTAGKKFLMARLNAACRIVGLQQEVEREREELRHYAAELAISNRSLQEAALTDALTGLPNRRYAIERMQQEWSAAHRSARSLACMVIDLDDFKQINDAYGHDVGDIVLRMVSDALRRVLRGQDVICRTGGDEFLVICPEASLEEAFLCGERLRREIDRLTVNNEDEILRLSISVGVAVRDATMSNANDLIKKADRSAFKAKHQGRNQVARIQQDEGADKPDNGAP